MASDEGNEPSGATAIGQIPLRRIARAGGGTDNKTADPSGNPMNGLVPFLDLFCRLTDAELARLSGVPPGTTRQLRTQVDAVCQALARYVDLLPRLADPELMRLTGASAKTIRFWRLCQPRVPESLLVATEQARSARTPEAAGVPTPVKQAPTHAMPGATDVTGKYSVTPSPDRFTPVPASPTPRGDGTPPPGATPVPPAPVRGVVAPKLPRASPTPVPARPSPPPMPASGKPLPKDGARPAAAGADLGLSGAPFPGYDYDPDEAAALDENEDGLFLGLDLPE